MNIEENEDNTIYKVVVNHEEQYSIWPADKDNALGWKDAGKSGAKAECSELSLPLNQIGRALSKSLTTIR